MRALARMPVHEKPGIEGCPACAELRTALRFCLGALTVCYGEELAGGDSDANAIRELVQGGIVLRAEIALRTACTCVEDRPTGDRA